MKRKKTSVRTVEKKTRQSPAAENPPPSLLRLHTPPSQPRASDKDTRISSLRDALAQTKKELQKTRGDLTKLSEYHRALLNNIPVPLLIVGRDYGLRYASREAQRMLNLGSSEPGIRVTDTMLALYIPHLRKTLADALAGGQAIEREIQNEEEQWYRILIQPYELPRVGIGGVVITLFDVDVQKRVEALFDAEQWRTRQMMDAMGGIFLVLDPDGTIAQVNKRGCELLGSKEQDIVGANWFDTYVAETSRSDARKASEQSATLLNRGPVSSEIPVVVRNGQQRLLRWQTTGLIDGSGGVRGLLGVGEDITLWRAAQVSALESEERFRVLLEMQPDSDFLTSDPSGYVTNWYAGSGPGRKFGAHEVIGKHISMFFPPEDFLAGKPMRLLRVAETQGRYEEDGWCIGGDGTGHRAKFVVLPLRGQDGKVTGFASIIRFLGEYPRFPQD